MMRAILLKSPGGPENLHMGQLEDPILGPDDLLIQVKATALNGADLLQRRGLYPPPPGVSDILGLEVAGEILEVGTQVQGWNRGQRVMALLAGGGYAEKVVIPASLAIPVPDNLNHSEAAAIPEVFLTAFLELVILGKIQPNEQILIHAGASGVGTAAIQLARELGARVLTTASSEKKLQRCKDLGAEVLIDYTKEDFVDAVKQATNGKGVNLILDLVGGSYWKKNIDSLAVGGRLLLVGLPGGAKAELNLRDLMSKRITVIGSTLRSRSIAEKADLTRQFVQFALPRFRNGKLIPVIDQVFDWKDVTLAHEYLEGGKNIGKVIMTVK